MKQFRILLILAITSISISIYANPIRPGKIKRVFKKSEVLNKYHVGFALYDLEKKEMVYGHQADKYFTPASNTKLFTFYAGLKMLKDSVPGLQYVERGDSLIFWGTGDPTLLHPDVMEQPAIRMLQNSTKRLFYAPGRYTGTFYGTGWSYDDYNEYYQPEIAELPVAGNVIRFSIKSGAVEPNVKTGFYSIRTDSLRNSGRFRIIRKFDENVFYQPLINAPSGFSQEVPIKYSTDVALKMLSDAVGKPIGVIKRPISTDVKTIYSIPADTLFKKMLQPSDNFMAEQLLFTYAVEQRLPMDTHKVIEHSVKNFLNDLPDNPQWVDGSGLSRQNLFTPRSMVKLCEKIYQEFSGREDVLFHLLPQGGKTGTLKNYFKSDPPFVFAKTGSLSNNHNLSGYLVTRSGKRYIFSFMNNNYTLPTAEIRKEMERILTIIHQS